MSQQQNSNTHDQVKCFCLDQTCAHALTDTVPSACTKVLSHIVGNCSHHCIVYQYRKLVCFRCCGISCNCCSTFLARPDFICGEYGSDVERRCFRPFLQNSAVPCILLTSESSCTRTVIQKLNETEALFDQKTLCYELKIKGLLCEIFGMILCEHQNDLAKFVPANQLELERLEQMLNYLNTHFESIISLQELADQVHLSREVCCRMDIILGFCVRNHSGIDLHDTDIDFFRPIVFQKRTAPLTYYASMRLFFFIICVQSKPGTYLIWLHPKCIIYQNHMDSVFMSGISGD